MPIAAVSCQASQMQQVHETCDVYTPNPVYQTATKVQSVHTCQQQAVLVRTLFAHNQNLQLDRERLSPANVTMATPTIDKRRATEFALFVNTDRVTHSCSTQRFSQGEVRSLRISAKDLMLRFLTEGRKRLLHGLAVHLSSYC